MLLESSVPDDPYLGARAVPLFPEGAVRALSRGAGTASAAARDHRHPSHQLADQSRRTVADRAHDRRDRRFGGRCREGVRRRARRLRHDRAQCRDRRARQQDPRRAAARSVRRRCRTCCSIGWSGSCAMSISTRGLASVVEHYRRRHCRGRGRARHGLAGGRRGGTHRAHRRIGQSRRAGGCSRAASPACRPCWWRPTSCWWRTAAAGASARSR